VSEIKGLVGYANELKGKYNPNSGDNNISVTGFSQGGGLSQLLSHTFGWNGNSQNAPGAGMIANNIGYQQHLSKLGISAKGVPNGFLNIRELGAADNFGTHLGKNSISLDTIGELQNLVEQVIGSGNIDSTTKPSHSIICKPCCWQDLAIKKAA